MEHSFVNVYRDLHKSLLDILRYKGRNPTYIEHACQELNRAKEQLSKILQQNPILNKNTLYFLETHLVPKLTDCCNSNEFDNDKTCANAVYVSLRWLVRLRLVLLHAHVQEIGFEVKSPDAVKAAYTGLLALINYERRDAKRIMFSGHTRMLGKYSTPDSREKLGEQIMKWLHSALQNHTIALGSDAYHTVMDAVDTLEYDVTNIEAIYDDLDKVVNLCMIKTHQKHEDPEDSRPRTAVDFEKLKRDMEELERVIEDDKKGVREIHEALNVVTHEASNCMPRREADRWNDRLRLSFDSIFSSGVISEKDREKLASEVKLTSTGLYNTKDQAMQRNTEMDSLPSSL